MAPIVHGLEATYSDRIMFTYLDIDDPANAAAMKDLQYIGRPHIYLLDGEGKILKQWLGAISEEELSKALSESID
jgi:thioredoxin-like negative regulator of GroEL